jgi:hypothetical protein
MPRMIRWTMCSVVLPQGGQLESKIPSRTRTMSMGEGFRLEDRGVPWVQQRIANLTLTNGEVRG